MLDQERNLAQTKVILYTFAQPCTIYIHIYMNIYIYLYLIIYFYLSIHLLSTSHKGSGTLTWGDKWWLALVKKATVAWGRRELYHKPNHMWPSSPPTVHHRLVARNMCGSYFVIVSQTSQCPFVGCRVGQSIIIGKESIRNDITSHHQDMVARWLAYSFTTTSTSPLQRVYSTQPI